MLKAVSTYIHIRERLQAAILQRLAEGGVAALEIFAARSHFDYASPSHVQEIAAWFAERPEIEFRSMHAPLYAAGEWGRFDSPPLNIAGVERKERVEAMDEIKRAVEVAERLPFRYLVLHLGAQGEHFSERKFEGALSSIEHLRAFAKPLGVELLVENIPNELTAPQKLVELIQTLHFDDLGVCLDVGHAHLEPGVEEAFEALKPFIRSVHVHDNHGMKDEHLWPGEGTIDWVRSAEQLRGAPQAPALVLELAGHPEGDPAFGKTVAPKMLETWKRLEL
jgi:sugar phosphate isomerase/epimerase